MTDRKTGDALTGGCACGAVRYAVNGSHDLAILCYCRACQYASGGSSAAQFQVYDKQIEVSGDQSTFERGSDAGFQVTKSFCATCGTPLWTVTERYPDARLVFAGTLDDPDAFRPMAEVNEEARPAWSAR